MPLVDSHAHIQGREYAADRPAMLARARAAGVIAIVTAGDDLASSAAGCDLAKREPDVWATVGIHPHNAATAPEDFSERLRTLAGSPRVVAIGEIGLDFYRDLSPRDVQCGVFERQLALADELRLPVVIHSRDADAATIAILEPWAAKRRAAGAAEPFGVMHCYAYGAERLPFYTGLGLYISIPGTVTYPQAALMQGAAVSAPLEMLVVETDCPYLTPQSRRGRRNEPALIAETASRIASLRAMEDADLRSITTENARRLYRLPALRTRENA
jgi:TatD DNase family protein